MHYALEHSRARVYPERVNAGPAVLHFFVALKTQVFI